MYPEIMLVPMREELTRLGVEELRTASDVDQLLGKKQRFIDPRFRVLSETCASSSP